MNSGRDLHRQNTPLTEETVLLAYQLEAYRADSQPWTDQLTDDTLALIHCICRNYEPRFATKQPTTSTTASAGRNLCSRSRAMSAAAVPAAASASSTSEPFSEERVVYPPDWPIDRSCLNQAVSRLHGLFIHLTSAPVYISGAKAFIESLSVRTIERSLGSKVNKPRSELVISPSFSSSFINAPRNDQTAPSTKRPSTETNQSPVETSQPPSGTNPPPSRPSRSSENTSSPPSQNRPLSKNPSSDSAPPVSTSSGSTELVSCFAPDVAALLFLPEINATPADERMANPQARLTTDSSGAGAFSCAQQEVLDAMFNQILRRLNRQGNGTSTPETPPPASVQTAPADPSIIRHDIALCLKDSANTWWTMELDDVTRYGLINHPDGVQAICDKLKKRFHQAPSRALAKFERMIYSVQDAQRGQSVAAYTAELVAQAKQCRFTNSLDILVLQIWRHLNLPLRLNIDEPSPGTFVEAFIQLLTQKELN
ncbi:hypothetical protein AJ78_08262 [Emergomyces pasteurianus Ep9510]|uniref:Uncharacterized protein n=1 Tax=Emergomyces pasteurianus Ep9510 TaxID=1447872 RepID=A0A1J9P4M9_9EURO|nr:hypothetical protein AJ78_08262 [Emergomyces pasteurianus Ep9510]